MGGEILVAIKPDSNKDSYCMKSKIIAALCLACATIAGTGAEYGSAKLDKSKTPEHHLTAAVSLMANRSLALKVAPMVTGGRYRVEVSHDLVHWEPALYIVAKSPSMAFEVPMTDAPSAFYRVVSWQ